MSESRIPLFVLFLFCVSYFIFYPSLILISDEQSYFNLALSFLTGHPGSYIHQEVLPQFSSNLVEAEYALGTPLFLTPIIGLLGNSGVYIFSILCFVLSFILTYLSISHLDYDVKGVLLLFFFLPLLLISRTVMSELPSVVLVSLSLWILIKGKSSHKGYLLIFFLGGVSILFRETNALIFGPILLHTFFIVRFRDKIGGCILFLLGVSCRLLANHFVYGDAFHLKHGYPFGLSYLPQNILLYTAILLGLIPGGLLFLLLYRGYLKGLFVSIVAIFTVVLLFYGYNAMDYSGVKMGLMMNGRFFIPLMPIFAICLGYCLKKYVNPTSSFVPCILYLGALVVGIGSQYYLDKTTDQHRTVANHLREYSNEVLIFDHTYHTNIGRYINPFLGNINKSLDISRMNDPAIVSQLFAKINKAYIIRSERNETEDKMSRNMDINTYMNQSLYNSQLDTTLLTGDGGIITIYEITAL